MRKSKFTDSPIMDAVNGLKRALRYPIFAESGV
jgi:hypothetical protein